MNPEAWKAVDRYLVDSLIPEAHSLSWVLDACQTAGLPNIEVAPAEGKLLATLVAMCGARRVLEIGTLGGYSTVWMANAMPQEGRIVTLEVDPHHAEVATGVFKRAGVEDRVELRCGAALDSLAQLVHDKVAPFDFVFVDADKPNNPRYLEFALQLTRPGSVLVFDNVIRDGNVIDAMSEDDRIQGVREMIAMISRDTRLSATALQTVGPKGYDGFAVARVIDS